MPFHSVMRLKVEIKSRSGAITFDESFSNVVSFTGSEDQGANALKLRGLSRTNTGDKLDDDVWELIEVTAKYGDCVPGVRMFQLVLKGSDFGARLNKREPSAVALYRSIMSNDTVRFTIYMGDKPYVLDVNLSYKLTRVTQPAAGC